MRRSQKFRGYRTHGRGMKAGRGGGIHGGKGNAGLHKHKYLHTVKYDPDHFGRHGFKRHPGSGEENTINLLDIEKNLQLYVENGKAKKEKEGITLNLQEMGYGKLLGKGALTKPVKIIVQKASAKAVERVKEAGGTVEVKK